MSTISVTLSADGIKAAQERLEKYRKAIVQGFDNGLRALAEAIAVRADEIYHGGKAAAAEGRGVIVASDGGDNRYFVTASGSQVGFLEFGTGAYSDKNHPYAADVTYPVYPGSYSDTVGARTYLRWVQTHGTDANYPYNREPTRAMYRAVTEFRQGTATRNIIEEEIQKVLKGRGF